MEPITNADMIVRIRSRGLIPNPDREYSTPELKALVIELNELAKRWEEIDKQFDKLAKEEFDD